MRTPLHAIIIEQPEKPSTIQDLHLTPSIGKSDSLHKAGSSNTLSPIRPPGYNPAAILPFPNKSGGGAKIKIQEDSTQVPQEPSTPTLDSKTTSIEPLKKKSNIISLGILGPSDGPPL